MATIYLDENSGLLMYKKDGKMTPVSTNAVFFPEDCVKFSTSGAQRNQLRFKDMTGTFLPVVATDGNPVRFATYEDVLVKQSREDSSLKTSDKTIVGAINELAVKSGSVSLSHTYSPGSELFTKYEILTTLPAGTYTITADVEVGADNIEAFKGACLVLGSITKPKYNASELIIDFNLEFTLEEETKIWVAYAFKDYVVYDLSMESPVDPGYASYEQTISISNIEIISKSKMSVTGVVKDTDGVYYWTLNGEWLLDDNGNKLPVSGKLGSNGKTPMFQLVDGQLYYRYSESEEWESLGVVKGEDGQDGKDGADGEDGKDGQDGADGKDGQDGTFAQLVVIDNNLNFYLNTDGYALEKEQSWTPLFEFIENGLATKVYPKIQTHDLVDNDTIKVTRSKKYIPGKYSIECSYTHTDEVVYKTILTINLITGATHYDLKVSPAYIKYNPNTGEFENVSISVYLDCAGGGYYEENRYTLSAHSNLHLTVDTGSGDDAIGEGLVFLSNGTADFSPNVLNTTTIKLVDQDNDLKDFQILSVVLDGKGMATEFPEFPELGNSLIWGGKSELNDNCFLGYVVHGQTYVYSLLPAAIGTSTSEKLAYAPMRLMIYIPQVIQDTSSFSRVAIPDSLAFVDDSNILIESPLLLQIGSVSSYKMSWDVCVGMTPDEIKSIQADVINLARSCFDFDAYTFPSSYGGTYTLQSYKVCSAIKSDNGRLNRSESTAADAKLYKTVKNIVTKNSNCKIGNYLINYIDTLHADKLHCEVYLIPYQPILDERTNPMWGIEVGKSTAGWVPASSSLSNGINTNQLGFISAMVEV